MKQSEVSTRDVRAGRRGDRRGAAGDRKAAARKPPEYGVASIDAAPASAGFAAPLAIQRVAARRATDASTSGGEVGRTGLPEPLKRGIERLSGLDMSGVQVHQNSARPARVGALAYTKGDDIFLAPGQERHLPHEAWHVVQQRQGRVAPTLQMKGGERLNDDRALEREADVMGSRALRAGPGAPPTPNSQRASQPGPAVVQRMRVETNFVDDRAYNVSHGQKLVCGLDYPNHELYVKDRAMVDDLNEKIEGMLEFKTPASKPFDFGDGRASYYKVYPRYKDSDKREAIGPATLKELWRLIEEESDGQPLGLSTTPEDLAALSRHVETIRKLMVQWDLHEGENELYLHTCKTKCVDMWRVLSKFMVGQADQAAAEAALSRFQTYLKDDGIYVADGASVLVPKLLRHIDAAVALVKSIRKSNPLLRRLAHYTDQVKSLDSPDDDLLLPRGCDLVSGTVLGKKTDHKTQDVFGMNFTLAFKEGDLVGKDRLRSLHHYATKILADGRDFITIEGFAKEGYLVFDNTWEFFMHGGRDTEVESFNDYTRTRYSFFDDLRDIELKSHTHKVGPQHNVLSAKQFHDLMLKDK